MPTRPAVLAGVVRGKTIELDSESGFSEGQAVTVVVQPVSTSGNPPSWEGLARAFGAWVDDEGLDDYLEWCRQERKQERRTVEP